MPAKDEPVVKIGRDEAELRSQIEDIPVVAAEHPDAGWRVSIVRRERTILVREQSDERRFAGAVGTKNRRVLAHVNRERQVIENGTVFPDDRSVGDFENWIGHYRKFKVGSTK